MKIIQWVKSHPWTVGGLVVGGGLVFLLVRNMGSSSTVVAAAPSGPSEDAQLAFAGLQLQGQIASSQANAALQAAALEADVEKFTAAQQAAVALEQLKVQEKISLADISASQSMFTIQNQAAIEAAQIAAATQNLAIQSGANIDMAQINSNKSITEQLINAFKPQPSSPAPTPSPVGNTVDNWAEYVELNPDLSSYYYSHPKTQKKMTLEEFGADHYQNYGQKEGRVGVGGVVYN